MSFEALHNTSRLPEEADDIVRVSNREVGGVGAEGTLQQNTRTACDCLSRGRHPNRVRPSGTRMAL